MSWLFPKSLLRTGTVFDWLEFDEILADYSSEVNGALNEHNFDEAIGADLIAANKVSETVAVRAKNVSDHMDVYTESALIPVPNSEQWSPVTGTALTLTSRGGALYVTYSFQVAFYDIIGFGYTTQPDGPGLHFAIEIDGSVQSSALLGSGDVSNEFLADGPAELAVVAGAGSVKARLSPHCVEGLFPVDAGPHTARLVARNPYSLLDGSKQGQYIACYDGIMLEIHQ